MAIHSSLWSDKAVSRLSKAWPFVIALVACIQTVVCGEAESTHDSVTGESELDTYSQQVTIVFANETAAERARVTVESLYDGHHRAVSCRWDDNWTSDNRRTRDVMEELGIRGTWYLNGRHFYPGGQPADYLPVAKELLKGGNSIGGHSLTHPYLTYFHSNRMFAETSGVRIDWEAALDRPVTSYAYSFVDLRPEPEGKQVLERSLKTLKRAGFYHVAEYLNFFDDVALELELSPIMPPENNPLDEFRKSVNWAYADEGRMEDWPMISNSMHAWYATERLQYGYYELRARLDLLAKLEDVWHCNQNEYAAYRRREGFRSVQLSPPVRDRREVAIDIRNRPELLALDDTTPLTIAVSGVRPEDIVDAYCQTAPIVSSDRNLSDRRLFHVSHDRDRSLPKKIGHVANVDNSAEIEDQAFDPDFPKIRGILSAKNDELLLQVENRSEHPLKSLRVDWRSPIGWQIASTKIDQSSIAKGQSIQVAAALLPSDEAQRRLGRAHFAAQLDFVWNGEPGRLHFTCQRPGDSPNDAWPLNGFALLGPIANAQFESARFVQQVEQDGCPDAWQLSDGSVINWRTDARDGYLNHDWLNPEYVRTMGTWDAVSPTYVLRSKIVSPTARTAQIVVSHEECSVVLLNGAKVEPARRCELLSGDNELVIVYPGVSMSYETPRLAACFVRIADPVTNRRLQDIRYRAY